MKAIHSSSSGHVLLPNAPIPTPGANEVLIKNVYVASNPKDYKLVQMISGYETIEGNDTAGYIHSLGSGVNGFTVGDKVAAYTKIKGGDQYGTNAEYSVAPVSSTFPLGPKTPLDGASTLPLAGMTAALALHRVLGLHSVLDPDQAKKPVVIYGASTSVGLYAVQLALLAELPVIAIAGSALDLLPSFGIPKENLIDYRGKSSEALSAEIKVLVEKLWKRDFGGVFDCVSTPQTQVTLSHVFGEEGGVIAGVWKPSLAGVELAPKVEVKMVRVGTVHEAFDEEWGSRMFKKFGEWLESGELKVNKVTIVEGGIEGIPEGLRRLEAGEVRAEKLVYRISDTPGLA